MRGHCTGESDEEEVDTTKDFSDGDGDWDNGGGEGEIGEDRGDQVICTY